MRKTPILLAIALFTTGLTPLSAQAFSFNPNNIISDREFTNPFAMDLNQIQYFLNRGALGTLFTEDWQGKTRSAAEIIWRASQDHLISPKVLLVTLQKEQSLVEAQTPSEKQLNWATGYAVCDNCKMDDPAIQRWKGFGKQVNSAAMQYTDGYLADIEKTGTTQGKYGPGVPVQVSNQTVVPENAATAALYAYTPHIHGNKLFATIWDRWFSIQHPTGTLLKAEGDARVYLVEFGYKRPITSWGAFISRFHPDLIIEVSPTALANYADGAPISLPNYSLVQDEDGAIFLLVDDALRPIANREVFRSLGFVEDELVMISNAERNQFNLGKEVTKESAHVRGALLRLEGTELTFYVQDGVRHLIPSAAVQKARFPFESTATVPAMMIEQYREGTPIAFPDGYLVMADDSPVVYVISEGKKRPIASEAVFTSYGWKWKDILTTSSLALNLHETGLPIEDVISR